MSNLRRGSVWAVVACGTFAGCSIFSESPTVRIADVQISSIGLSGATVVVVAEVQNPNRYALTATGLSYRLESEEISSVASETLGASEGPVVHVLAEGESVQRVTVEGEGDARVRVTVPFEYRDLGRAVLTLLQSGELRYRLTGDVRFDAPIGDIRVPFEDTGDLEL